MREFKEKKEEDRDLDRIISIKTKEEWESKKEIKDLNDKCDKESIIVKTIERLIHALNKDYMKLPT